MRTRVYVTAHKAKVTRAAEVKRCRLMRAAGWIERLSLGDRLDQIKNIAKRVLPRGFFDFLSDFGDTAGTIPKIQRGRSGYYVEMTESELREGVLPAGLRRGRTDVERVTITFWPEGEGFQVKIDEDTLAEARRCYNVAQARYGWNIVGPPRHATRRRIAEETVVGDQHLTG